MKRGTESSLRFAGPTPTTSGLRSGSAFTRSAKWARAVPFAKPALPGQPAADRNEIVGHVISVVARKRMPRYSARGLAGIIPVQVTRVKPLAGSRRAMCEGQLDLEAADDAGLSMRQRAGEGG
jgi:hypothetical protein